MFLRPRSAHGDEATAFEPRQFPLHRARTCTDQSDQLRRLEAAMGLPEDQSEHALLSRREQRIRETGSAPVSGRF